MDKADWSSRCTAIQKIRLKRPLGWTRPCILSAHYKVCADLSHNCWLDI